MKLKYFLPPLLLLLVIPLSYPVKGNTVVPYSEFKARIRSGEIRRVELVGAISRPWPARPRFPSSRSGAPSSWR